MSDDPRAVVAAEHGLAPEAAQFLTGETVEEMEASAVALAQLLGRGTDRIPHDAGAVDPISAGLRAKAEQKASLQALLTGRNQQPRDEQGRYTGFDGGARRPVRRPRDPEREHGQLIAEMAAISRTFNRPS